MEVHCIQEKSTQIAKQFLTDIESIDDPKWNKNSYVSHVFLHVDLTVKFPKEQRINAQELIEKADCKSSKNSVYQTTIFEKLFWDYLSNSSFFRNTSTKLSSRNWTYKEVLNNKRSTKKKESRVAMDKHETLNILSRLVSGACRDLARNHLFVPQDLLD